MGKGYRGAHEKRARFSHASQGPDYRQPKQPKYPGQYYSTRDEDSNEFLHPDSVPSRKKIRRGEGFDERYVSAGYHQGNPSSIHQNRRNTSYSSDTSSDGDDREYQAKDAHSYFPGNLAYDEGRGYAGWHEDVAMGGGYDRVLPREESRNNRGMGYFDAKSPRGYSAQRYGLEDFKNQKYRNEIRMEMFDSIRDPVASLNEALDKFRKNVYSDVLKDGKKIDEASKKEGHDAPTGNAGVKAVKDVSVKEKKAVDPILFVVQQTVLDPYKRMIDLTSESSVKNTDSHKDYMMRLFGLASSMMNAAGQIRKQIEDSIEVLNTKLADEKDDKAKKFIQGVIDSRQTILDLLSDEKRLPDPNAFIHKTADMIKASQRVRRGNGIPAFLRNIRRFIQRASFLIGPRIYMSKVFYRSKYGKYRVSGVAPVVSHHINDDSRTVFRVAMKDGIKTFVTRSKSVKEKTDPSISKEDAIKQKDAITNLAYAYSELMTKVIRKKGVWGPEYVPFLSSEQGGLSKIAQDVCAEMYDGLDAFQAKMKGMVNFFEAFKTSRELNDILATLVQPKLFVEKSPQIREMIKNMREKSLEVFEAYEPLKLGMFEENRSKMAKIIEDSTKTLKDLREELESHEKLSSGKTLILEKSLSEIKEKAKELVNGTRDLMDEENPFFKTLDDVGKISYLKRLKRELKSMDGLDTDVMSIVSNAVEGKALSNTMQKMRNVITSTFANENMDGINAKFNSAELDIPIADLVLQVKNTLLDERNLGTPREQLEKFIKDKDHEIKVDKTEELMKSFPDIAIKINKIKSYSEEIRDVIAILDDKISILTAKKNADKLQGGGLGFAETERKRSFGRGGAYGGHSVYGRHV